MEESAGKEKKAPKKGVIVLVLLVVIAALCAAGYGIWYQMPQQRFTRQMDLGERYLNDLDYEQAVAAFSTALEILPDNEEAEDALSGTYVSWSDSYVSEGDYQSAVDTLGQGQSALPDNETLLTATAKTYIDWVDVLLAQGDLESAEAVIGEAEEAAPCDEVTQKAEEVAAKISGREAAAAAEDAIRELPDEMTAGEIEESDEAVQEWLAGYKDVLRRIVTADNPIYIDAEAGFGIYRLNDYQTGLYIGGFDGESREGTAVWIVFFVGESGADTTYYLYQGEWSADAPNGVMTGQSGTDVARGTVQNGLWEGTITNTGVFTSAQDGSKSALTWSGTCSGGTYVALSGPDADGMYTIGTAEDGGMIGIDATGMGLTYGVIGWAEALN